jgi:hypothetical protein
MIVKMLPTTFTITVSGLSGANTMRALRDVLEHPGDPEAESRLCAALALCRSLKSTEGATSFTLNGRKPVPVEIGEQILRECTKATRKARGSVPTAANA